LNIRPNVTDENVNRKLTMEMFHLFAGQPQCMQIDDVYASDVHLHKEIEMAFVLSGQVQIMVENHEFIISTNELLCIRGGVLHEYLPKKQEADIVKIKFMKEWLLPAFFQSIQMEAYQQLYNQVFKTHANKTIRDIITAMLYCSLPRYKEYFYYGKLIELTASMLAAPELISQSLQVSIENLRYMEAALVYMQDNCSSKLTLKMLADHLGLTESYCSKYIKKSAGISFVGCLNALRVNNAQRLLIYTDCTITEIVEQTGFLSVQTFNRVFKRQTGQSPSEYRKRKRSKAWANRTNLA